MAAEAFWLKKVSFYFDGILDTDRDGKLNTKDLTYFKEFYKTCKNLKSSSPEYEKFSKFLNIWIGSMMQSVNKAKSDGENFVTGEEFRLYSNKLRAEIAPKKALPANLSFMNDYGEALFAILDHDDDGYISKSDFLANAGTPEDLKCREKSWSLMSDKNDNVKIDKKLFNEYFIQFLTSSNPSDRGNWIFGYFEH